MDRRFYEKHYTKVDPKYFEPIVEGMWQSVHKEGGTSRTAYLPGLDVCGKTGTAQNPRGKDHSTFLSFAPKDNPRIAISVYVENGGFGASAALPIASLLEEYYLTDTVTRPWLVEMVKQKTIYYPPMENNGIGKLFEGVDRWTVLIYVLIVLVGFVAILSASYEEGAESIFFLLAFLYETARLDGNIVRRSGRRVAGRCEHLSQVGLSVLCPGIADPGSRSAVRS